MSLHKIPKHHVHMEPRVAGKWVNNFINSAAFVFTLLEYFAAVSQILVDLQTKTRLLLDFAKNRRFFSLAISSNACY